MRGLEVTQMLRFKDRMTFLNGQQFFASINIKTSNISKRF
jgi:hypothetical protein